MLTRLQTLSHALYYFADKQLRNHDLPPSSPRRPLGISMQKTPASTLITTGRTAQPRIPKSCDIPSTPRTITVCHPVWRLGRGGLERQLVQTVNRLPRDRFKHVVAVCGWDEISETLASQIGKHVEIVRHPPDAKQHNWSRRLAATLSEYSVDLVHVRGMSLLLDSLMAVDLRGDCRIACSFHGFQTVGGDFQGVRKKVYREALLRCHDRWAVGEAAARAIEQELNLPSDAFGVVRNGVDVTRFAPATDRASVRNSLQLPQDRTIVLCLGNLKPIKGQAVLLEALGRIGHAADQVTVVFIGADGVDGRLQRWAKQHLDLMDVRFVREQDDPLPWFQAADVFVQPSLSEGLSNALLEAMACGLAVIATNVGGNAEVVVDGRSGWLVPANEPAGLAFALSHLLTRPALRAELAGEAREHVSRMFNIETMIGELSGRYRTLGVPPTDENENPTVQADVRHRLLAGATLSSLAGATLSSLAGATQLQSGGATILA